MQKIAQTRITLQSSAMSRKPIAVQAASPIAEGGRRRLQFLSSFMSTVGGSGADVARVVGKTRACVSNWFRADDTRLSYCYDYISSKGYCLEVSLEGMETVYEDDGVSIVIEKRTPASGERECVRLAFLKEAMARTGITKRAVADKLGVEYNTVRNWFIVDDVYVSYIFGIADIFGFRVCFRIRPQD